MVCLSTTLRSRSKVVSRPRTRWPTVHLLRISLSMRRPCATAASVTITVVSWWRLIIRATQNFTSSHPWTTRASKPTRQLITSRSNPTSSIIPSIWTLCSMCSRSHEGTSPATTMQRSRTSCQNLRWTFTARMPSKQVRRSSRRISSNRTVLCTRWRLPTWTTSSSSISTWGRCGWHRRRCPSCPLVRSWHIQVWQGSRSSMTPQVPWQTALPYHLRKVTSLT